MNSFLILLICAGMACFVCGEERMLIPSSVDCLSSKDRDAVSQHVTPWKFENKSQVNKVMRKGEILVVPLEENGTTGYSWQVLADSALPCPVKLLQSTFTMPGAQKGLCGAGGIRMFIFKAEQQIEKFALHFRYVRPWEKNVEPVLQFTVLLTVTE